MRIVLSLGLSRFELEPAGPKERTGRRSITYSPAAGATVTLHPRRVQRTDARRTREMAA
jgi:hypothetical protein